MDIITFFNMEVLSNMTDIRVLTLTHDSSNISLGVSYLNPEHILEDMYKIIGCESVYCTEIEVDGKYFDVCGC